MIMAYKTVRQLVLEQDKRDKMFGWLLAVQTVLLVCLGVYCIGVLGL